MTSSIQPIACISRKDTFTINHVLNNPLLSSTANKHMYGSCNNRSPHQHRYTVEVICRGTVDLCIGTVMSLNDLRTYMHRTVYQELDGKNLNEDIDFFKTVPSTIENLAVFIWRSIKTQMNRPELLYEIKLIDDDDNCVIYNGGAEYYNMGTKCVTSDTE